MSRSMPLFVPLFVSLWSTPAFAAGKADALALFEEYVAREHRFDPALADLYADEALVSTTARAADGTTQDVVLPFAILRAQMPAIMEYARTTDERSAYEATKVRKTDAGFQITARRTSLAHCYTDDAFTLDLAERDGTLRIVRHHTYTEEASSCPSSAEVLQARMAALQGLLEPHLPIRLDDVTTIDAVRIEGDTFVYVQRLANVPLGDPDAAAVAEVLGPFTQETLCAPSMLHSVREAGGTIRLEWVHAGGEPFVAFDVGPTGCR